MQKTSKLPIILSIIITALICLWFSGRLLDWEAERVVQQLYLRDQQGIIQGLQSIAIEKKNATTALVLIHGFMDSPAIFADVAHDIANKSNLAVYAPLLPAHGRNLQAAAKLDNEIVNNYLQQYLAELAKQYQKLTVVGFSYGGAMVANLAYNNKLPNNAQIILLSPAIYIRSNNFTGNLKAQVFHLWRNYCNYPGLGCRFPAYGSGDTVAKPMFDKEKTLRYNVASAVAELYKFDDANRYAINHIHKPYSVIMAADDNRIDYEREKTACLNNKQYCTFYSFPTGKHMFFWGADKLNLENLLIKLATQKTKF
jgi:esterase/lipase